MDVTANSTSPFFCPDSTACANTTPAESPATAAALASTRSRGALRLSTARMNVSVSVKLLSCHGCDGEEDAEHPSSQAEVLINMKDSHWLCTGKGCATFSCNFIVPGEV